ncbi:MAG: hypothetical protein KDD62_15690, partial [Bdellovibrionales bacterium]|nr:hypothetical protein [Bdellovibrionales bacterium]
VGISIGVLLGVLWSPLNFNNSLFFRYCFDGGLIAGIFVAHYRFGNTLCNGRGKSIPSPRYGRL